MGERGVNIAGIAAEHRDQLAQRLAVQHFDVAVDDRNINAVGARQVADERLPRAGALEGELNDQIAVLQTQRRDQLAHLVFHSRHTVGRGDEAAGDGHLRVGEDAEDFAFLHHTAVFHHGDAVADLLDDGHFVGDYDHGNAQLAVELLKKAQNVLRRLRVERAGGLVAQEHLRVAGQRAGDGYALLLSAGEHARIGVHAVLKADDAQKLGHLPVLLRAGKVHAAQRESHVVVHRARAHQVEQLEDHADRLARLPKTACAQAGQLLSGDEHAAVGGTLQKVDAADERGLAGAGKADDAENVAGHNVQIHVHQRLHAVLAVREGLGNVLQADHWFLRPAGGGDGILHAYQSPIVVK